MAWDREEAQIEILKCIKECENGAVQIISMPAGSRIMTNRTFSGAAIFFTDDPLQPAVTQGMTEIEG